MKKNEAIIKVCGIDLLRRVVIVCVGSMESVEKKFLDPKFFKNYTLSEEKVKGIWDHVKTEWNFANDKFDVPQGVTFAYNGDVFILMPEWDSRVFIHEAYHAAQAVLRAVNSSDEELGAFIISYIFERVCWTKGSIRKMVEEDK